MAKAIFSNSSLSHFSAGIVPTAEYTTVNQTDKLTVLTGLIFCEKAGQQISTQVIISMFSKDKCCGKKFKWR